MTSFDWKKNVEDSIKDTLIITNAATGLFFGLKAVGVKLPSLDAIYIMKLGVGTCRGVLVKDYAVYRKWINKSDTTKILWPVRAIKLLLNG